jgi:hypothetical protein
MRILAALLPLTAIAIHSATVKGVLWAKTGIGVLRAHVGFRRLRTSVVLGYVREGPIATFQDLGCVRGLLDEQQTC